VSQHSQHSQAAAPQAAAVSAQSPDCEVGVNADGSAFAMVRIPPDVFKRIKTRAAQQDLGDYMWQCIFKRALFDHVY
jgi:hypothetical protein